MKICILLAFLTIGTAFAGTHVNISFSQQQHPQTAAVAGNSDETRSESAQLKQPSESFEQFQTNSNYYRGDQNGRSARIQADDKKTHMNNNNNNNNNNNKNNANQEVVADAKQNQESAVPDYKSRSERVQNTGRTSHFNHQSNHQNRGFFNSNNGEHQQYDQLKKMNALDKQNMEFERYIQNYHSGPTVETVYESAKPRSQQSLAPSSANEGPQRVVAINQRMSKVQKFERQVALPSMADSLPPSSEASKQTQNVVVNHQPVQAAETAASTSSLIPSSSSASTSSSSSPVSHSTPVASVSASSASGNNFKVNLNQRPASVGSDGINFDLSTSYNKPNYNEPSFKYDNDGHSDGHFHNQYPPSVDEPQGGYGDYFQPAYNNNNDHHYYGNFYDRPQVETGYLPAEHINQRPVVTKTIQIAQPAIKAKKYEIRHPAIQKEFYDIEERVLIKPAGTVVVELERPVAKILKGETTLPLGHPHPAVAGAYHNNGNNPSFSNIVYSSAGSSSANQGNNQYSPNYNTKSAAEHQQASSFASNSPAYDQGSKEVVVDSNVHKPYNGENHFVAAASTNENKPQSREHVVVTDGHGNQRQVSPDQFSYSRDETDKGPSRSTYNHRNPFVYNDNHAPQRTGFQESNYNNGQSKIAPQRSGFQESNYNNGQSNIAPQRSGFQESSHSNVQSNVAPQRSVFQESNHHNSQSNVAPQRSVFQESNHNNGQSNVAPQRSGFQANVANRDGFDFEAEYINNANPQKDSKPARLQEAPARLTESQQQIIKHEHKIVLSPSQHNIYLARNHDVPQTKFVEEAAHVREIKPYLQNHRGPVIVYASTKQNPDQAYTQRSEYRPQARVSSQVVQYREPAGRVSHAKNVDKRVEYSAPYAQMRYNPDDHHFSANYHQEPRHFSNFDRNDRRKSEKLILEDKPATEKMVTAKKSNDNMMMTEKKTAPQAHIEIEIPHHSSQMGNGAVFVSSTIRPMMMNNGKEQMHNSKLEISVTNNGEPVEKQQNVDDSNEKDKNMEQSHNMQYSNEDKDETESDSGGNNDDSDLSNYKTKPDCDQSSLTSGSAADSDNYEAEPSQHGYYGQQKFMRIVEDTNAGAASSGSEGKSAVEPAAVTNIQPQNVDVSVKSTNGHVVTPGSRVIAATPAPRESSPSESFHKRRIVVNHPFQTVREVVEHEPYTNYHEVQVNEPASPALYHSANYFQSHGDLRQAENGHMIYYH